MTPSIDKDIMEKAFVSEFYARTYTGEAEADVLIDLLRSALQAVRNEERERCAKIAESTIRDADDDEEIGDEDWVWRTSGNRRAHGIGTAIRKGE